MPDPPLTGGCMCGAVRYALSAPPREAGYCHCTRCQRRTGTAAAISATLAPGSLRITQGAGHVRTWTPPAGFAKAFCGECGSGLWSAEPASGEPYAVRMGTLDADPGVRPSYRQFLAYAAAWEPVPEDGVAHHPESRP